MYVCNLYVQILVMQVYLLYDYSCENFSVFGSKYCLSDRNSPKRMAKRSFFSKFYTLKNSPLLSSSSSLSSSLSNVESGMSYNLITGLLGSLTIKYLPSFWAMTWSTMHRTIPQQLSIDKLIWAANSDGLN